MIPVLCSSCNTHLANTDVQRLDWPLCGEMFSPVYAGWFLRPGMLNLDVFCPVCGAFPFFHDPYVAGANAVGKNLKVRGADGKPVVMTVKEIIMGAAHKAVADMRKMEATQITAEFPCPACGAKKRFHKKGCSLNAIPRETKEAFLKQYGKSPVAQVMEVAQAVDTVLDKHARLSEQKDRQRAGSDLISSVAGRVQGMSADKGDGPPTVAEINEVLADREARRLNDREEDLRPGEGFQETGAQR